MSIRTHHQLHCRSFILIGSVLCSPLLANELNIISPHSPEIRKEFTIGFAHWYQQKTGDPITLHWLDVGGTGEAINYIKSRNSGKNPAGGVDVFFGGGDLPFIKLSAAGLLAKHALPDSLIRRIPHFVNGIKVYPGDSLWYGAALSGFGIIFNKEVARRNGLPLPATWEDLAKPEYAGWVASGDPRYSGSIHVMYEIILQAYGWEKGWDIILRMGANVPTFTKSASAAAKDVSLGQAAFGMVIDFYAFIEIERYGKQRLGFLMPPAKTVINPDGIAILSNAANPKAASDFVNYVLGEGQKLWVLRRGVPGGPQRAALCRFPVDSTLYALDASMLAVVSNPYTTVSPFVYDGAKTGRRWDLVGDLIAAQVIAPHQYLRNCWRNATRRKLTADQYSRFFRIGVSEEQAFSLAQSWNKREFAEQRIKIMNQWTTQAIQRYRNGS